VIGGSPVIVHDESENDELHYGPFHRTGFGWKAKQCIACLLWESTPSRIADDRFIAGKRIRAVQSDSREMHPLSTIARPAITDYQLVNIRNAMQS
jgi:hypothetical protein